MIITVITFLLTVGVDRLTKFLAMNNLVESVPIIDGVFYLTYAQNTGVAFGMFGGNNTIFIVLNSAIALAIAVYCVRTKPINTFECISRGLVLAGAIGNIIDRIAYGFVVDFLHFALIDFPVFNVADSAIFIGMAGYILLYLFASKKHTADASANESAIKAEDA